MGSGASDALQPKCRSQFKTETYKCLFAENALTFVETPFFLMNSAVDMWYSQYVVGIRCVGWPPIPETQCTGSEVMNMQMLLRRWSEVFLPIVEANRQNGYFIDNCIVH